MLAERGWNLASFKMFLAARQGLARENKNWGGGIGGALFFNFILVTLGKAATRLCTVL